MAVAGLAREIPESPKETGGMISPVAVEDDPKDEIVLNIKRPARAANRYKVGRWAT